MDGRLAHVVSSVKTVNLGKKRRGSSSATAKPLKKRKNDKKKGVEIVKSACPNNSLGVTYFPSPDNSLGFEMARNGSRCRNDGIRSVESKGGINVTYPLDMSRPCVSTEKGKRLEQGVVSFLSNGGKRSHLVRNNGDPVEVESIAGKHILICCFKLPLPTNDPAAFTCRAMISAYSRLVLENDFEMVMVAKMTGAADEAAFNRFFHAFPCLAIPFSDTESRDFVCMSLGLTHPYEDYAAIVVDPRGTVLQTDGECFFEYGASGFPYNDAHLAALAREDEEIKRELDFSYKVVEKGEQVMSCHQLAEWVSLVELLGGSDLLLSRSGGDKISVSDLSKKSCVGLYLCLDGHYLRRLEMIRQGCVTENLEFEIVVVHVPLLSDPTSYVKAVQLALEEDKLSSWWVMPMVDEKATRRLWRLFGQNNSDELIILAEGGKSGELDGRCFMEELVRRPFVNSYPFTRKTMLDAIVSHLRSLELVSLLGSQLLSPTMERVPVSNLKGWSVLLYLDWYGAYCNGGGFYPKMLIYYKQIKEHYPESEVVFVPLDAKPLLLSECVAVPWLELPHPAAIRGSVVRNLFPRDEPCPALIAFGSDGLIRSRCAHARVGGDSLFADTLFRETFNRLSIYHRV